MPKISVVMPVYNGEKYLREAMDSILNQTFNDFEFIIINDASKDSTEEIIKSYTDDRIIYIKNEQNLGVAGTLNRGLDIAKGEYIARMDADDISMPKRFQKQVAFMDKHHEIGVCGTAVKVFGEDYEKNAFYVSNKENVKINMIFSSCLCHPTVMIRGEIIRIKNYRYDLEYEKIEDYELWKRILREYDIDNLKDRLLKYRIHQEQITQNYSDVQKKRMRKIIEREFRVYNIQCEAREIDAFCDFCTNEFDRNMQKEDLKNVLEKIYENNKATKNFNQKKLRSYFGNILINLYNGYTIKEIKKNRSLISWMKLIRYAIRKRITIFKRK